MRKTKSTQFTFAELQSICTFNGTSYISRKGKAYINALSKIVEIKNTNDTPFLTGDIIKQPLLNDFKFKGLQDFQYTCLLEIAPMQLINNKRKNEEITATNFANSTQKNVFKTHFGVVYLLTCTINGREHIIKIGSTRTSFAKRLGSYNCGTVVNWRTASTTNIRLLQSMVASRKSFKLYICDCSDNITTYKWHGIVSVPFASAKALAYEDILIKQFIKEFGHKPLANVQAKATEI